jgi:rRNA maturation protein Nop10
MVWNLKSCLRCGGDTYINEEAGQVFETCLQCGYEIEVQGPSAKKLSPNRRDRVLAAANKVAVS